MRNRPSGRLTANPPGPDASAPSSCARIGTSPRGRPAPSSTRPPMIAPRRSSMRRSCAPGLTDREPLLGLGVALRARQEPPLGRLDLEAEAAVRARLGAAEAAAAEEARPRARATGWPVSASMTMPDTGEAPRTKSSGYAGTSGTSTPMKPGRSAGCDAARKGPVAPSGVRRVAWYSRARTTAARSGRPRGSCRRAAAGRLHALSPPGARRRDTRPTAGAAGSPWTAGPPAIAARSRALRAW